jgi:zinc protease
VEKYFSGIPTGAPTPRLRQWATRHNGKKIIDVSDHVARERSYLAWSAPGFFSKGDAELDLISLMLTDGISSRLNKALIHDQQICLDVSSDHSAFEGAGIFSIAATAKSGKALERVEDAIIEQLVLLAQKGPDPIELARAKNKWRLRFFTQLERIGGFGGKADLLNKYNTFLGNPNMFAADLERHTGLTAQNIKQIAAEWLTAANVLVLRFHPITAHDQTQALDRSKAPALGADAPFKPPEVKVGTLENGLTVLVIERHDLPKVAVSIGVRAGSAFDPPGKFGLARFTVEMMKRGTRNRTAVQVEDEFGDLGTSLEANIDRDYSALGFEVLEDKLEPGMQIFADAVQDASFSEADVAGERQALLNELREFQSNGQTLAALLAPSLIFGSAHPYGHPAQGLPSGIQKIQRNDLVQFHAVNWTPRAAALVFAGNIQFSAAMLMAKKYFSQWPDRQPPSLNMPAPVPADPDRVYVINTPGSSLAFIRQVLLLPGIESSDYAAIQLADTVWGGGSAARLNMNLREDKGYAFSVFSHAFFYPKYSDWQAYGSIQAGKVRESVTEFLSELKGLAHDRPITAEELRAAKGSRVRGYAQQFESLDQVARQALRLWVDGLPISRLSSEIPQFQQIDLETVNAATRKYAVPQEAVLLIVGDLAKIAPQLAALYGHKISILDSEGNPAETRVH